MIDPHRDAILHIGTEKTGTTSIQKMLAARRQDLIKLGFCYPSCPGEESHFALAVYAAPESAPELNGAPLDEAAFTQSLADELAALPDDVHTVIFSSEHCHSRLVSDGQVRKLHDLLKTFFKSVTVVVYLRRQDILACSSYSTMLKYGFAGRDIFPDFPGPILANDNTIDRGIYSYFDFEALLDRYASVFGKTALRPRIFENDMLHQGDVMLDFLLTCGLPAALADGAQKANCAIPVDGQELLILLNAYLADSDFAADGLLAGRIRDVCAAVAQTQLSGRPRLPPRAVARKFYANFHDVNERVRAAWFPERGRLFDDDFGRYEEHPGANYMSSPHERALNAAFVCLTTLVRQYDELALEKDQLFYENGRLLGQRAEFLRQLDAVIAGFTTSTSWRLTKPLRAVSVAVRALIGFLGLRPQGAALDSSSATAP